MSCAFASGIVLGSLGYAVSGPDLDLSFSSCLFLSFFPFSFRASPRRDAREIIMLETANLPGRIRSKARAEHELANAKHTHQRSRCDH